MTGLHVMCRCGHRGADHQLPAPAGERRCVRLHPGPGLPRLCGCADFQPAVSVTR